MIKYRPFPFSSVMQSSQAKSGNGNKRYYRSKPGRGYEKRVCASVAMCSWAKKRGELFFLLLLSASAALAHMAATLLLATCVRAAVRTCWAKQKQFVRHCLWVRKKRAKNRRSGRGEGVCPSSSGGQRPAVDPAHAALCVGF